MRKYKVNSILNITSFSPLFKEGVAYYHLFPSKKRKWSEVKVTQSCPTLCTTMDCSPWNSLGQNTGVGRLSIFQGIFPTQESNLGLLHCRQILYQLRYQGSPHQTCERRPVYVAVLLKYKRDRESFCHKHYKGDGECPPKRKGNRFKSPNLHMRHSCHQVNKPIICYWRKLRKFL